jgi:lipopolysaccharide biosynthesis regulator YciM
VLAKLDMQTGQYQEAIEQCRKVLVSNPDDQTAVYRLIQALRKTGQTKEIPDLLQRLAKMREKATQDERERSRYHLYEDDSSTTDEAAPPASQP